MSSNSTSRDAFCKMLLTFALLILLHAAYSVAEWRALTRTSSTSSAARESKPGLESGNEDQT